MDDSHLESYGWSEALAASFTPHQRDGLQPARVIEEQKDLYRVATRDGIRPASPAGSMRHAARDGEELPAVGDWVAITASPTAALIRAVLARRSALRRRAAGRADRAQVIAANVDFVLVVTALDRDFNPRRLERAVTQVWESGAQPAVILNKADLCSEPERFLEAALAAAPGATLHLVSAMTGVGLDDLRGYDLPGRTAVVIGMSGVGKSTLVNALLGAGTQSVGEVRPGDGRGRHTTTARRLIRLPGGGLLVDTPGMRELGLWDDGASGEAISHTFHEVETLAATCRFRDCQHGGEPGCAVDAALRSGQLDPDRIASFHKLRREQEAMERRRDVQARTKDKRAGKAGAKALREMAKRRDGWR